MQRFSIIFLFLLLSVALDARQVDSTYLEKYKVLNDYTTLGVQYEFGLSNASFDPDHNQEMTMEPFNIGIVYTRYGKLFGYMPYFGIQAGIFYTKEAIHFKKNNRGAYSYYLLGAAKREMEVLEIPVMAHLHFDFWKMRILANVGIFGGYRFSVHRSEYVDKSADMVKYEDIFHPKENRWDYGLKAGGGIALILDPIEIHLTAAYKYSWSNLHQPNTNYRYEDSPYYYNWSYPTNILISLGVHYQLTRRVGLTKKQLKQEAREEAMRLLEESGIRAKEEPEGMEDTQAKEENTNEKIDS